MDKIDKHDKEFETYLRQFRLRLPGPPPEIAAVSRRNLMMWLLAAAVVVLAVGITAVLVRNEGSGSVLKATVEAAGSPSMYRAGESIEAGQAVRSNSAVGLVLALEDGSRVEMREQSELKLESADDGIRVRLNDGSIVVTAAKQVSGHHFYVHTRDAVVSVVGTVFLVTAEQSGTSVAVVEGEVHVQQGADLKKLLPGDQVVTNPSMQMKPVAEQISWSRSATEFVALLPQLPAASQAPQTLDGQRFSSQSALAENLFRMAESSFEQGQFATALELFRESLNADMKPKWLEVWAHINIGKIHDVRSQRSLAVTEYQRAVITGDDTYGAQAEAKKYLGVPFRLSQPTQEGLAAAIPSLVPEALLSQRRQAVASYVEDEKRKARQEFEGRCTSCHSAEIAMRLGSIGPQFSVSDRALLSSKQTQLAALLKKGFTAYHPEVVRVQAEISALLGREAETKNSYSSFVLSHSSKYGGTISGPEFPALIEYLFEETGRKSETQAPSAPVQPNDKEAPKEAPDVAGARLLNSACTGCHDLGVVVGLKEDKASWERIIIRMIGYGAGLKDSEIPVLADYLFKHYGPQSEAPGARILNSACTTCHDLGPLTVRKEDRASWERIVNGMVGYGASVKDSEIPVLVDYLFSQYGPPKEPPTGAGPAIRRP